MTKSVTLKARLTPAEPKKRQAIISAVNAFATDLHDPKLSELSSNTIVEALDAHPDGIFTTDDRGFEAVANVYVTLNYGEDTSVAESFPALVKGHFNGPKAEVDDVRVDTSSFRE